MPALELRSTNFPAHLELPPVARIEFAWNELIWAAITVGRRELDHVVRHGTHSFYEIAYRCALLWANLCELNDGRLKRSAAYDGLDPFEKSAISYFLGLTVSKLLASRFLSVGWLLHLDVYRNELGLNIGPGGRPDLLGLDYQDQWVIMEAKGRTNGLDRNALARAKEQAGYVLEVNGAPPKIGVGLQAYFDRGQFSVSWEDPSPKERGERSIRLELHPERVRATYYRPFRSLLRDTEVGRRRVFIGPERVAETVQMPDLDVEVGTTRVEDVVPISDVPPVEVGDVFVGPDEVVVRAGHRWTSDQMRLEPQARL